MKLASRVSPDIRVRLCPRSHIKVRPLLYTGPNVSMARGNKMCVIRAVHALYLILSRSAAIFAAVPAVSAVAGKYEEARVSMTVSSHMRLRPPCQRIKARPSGLLPSEQSKSDLIVGKPDSLAKPPCTKEQRFMSI